MQKVSEFHIFALASHGKGISGGDRIWIELARRWSNQFKVIIHTWNEGKEMGERQNLKGKYLIHKISPIADILRIHFIVSYIARIIEGIHIGLTLKLEDKKETYIYNASEFWMDAFPCILLKMRYRNITWVATWYQTAPNPFKGFSEKERSGATYRLRALAYWLTQLPIKPLINAYADKVIVNNEDEKKQFSQHTKKGNTIVLIGAVPLEDIQNFKPKTQKMHYDAVFQGRFHPQKGVVELISVWRDVVKNKPNAKLAMIGDGPLRSEVEGKINEYDLEENVDLLGFVFDGDKKYSTFSNSKMVLHPAFYDSGGMATAEAMAFGIPAIGFDLKAYESYYPKGMITVKNEKEFSKAILKFLDDEKLRKKIGKEAKFLIEKKYSWNTRANEILNQL